MAHELAFKSNGQAAMAYVGDTPWHGYGQSLTKGASIDVWKKEAGLDWDAIKTPLQGWSQPDGPAAIDFPEHVGIYRSDTMAPLAIVGAGYKVVQPGEVLEFFRALVEAGGWYIHTAGVLKGGRKVWAMATNDSAASVGKKDVVKNNLLLATSMDGSMKTVAVQTAVRVVCNNTLAMALNGARDASKVVAVSHRSHFDHDEALNHLGITDSNRFAAFMERARQLADTPIHLDEARHVLHRVFNIKKEDKPNFSWIDTLAPVEQPAADLDNRGVTAILNLFQGAGRGADLKTAQGTRWGLLNAITEHVDHNMGRTGDGRLDSAWFGRGNTIKTDALSLLTAA